MHGPSAALASPLPPPPPTGVATTTPRATEVNEKGRHIDDLARCFASSFGPEGDACMASPDLGSVSTPARAALASLSDGWSVFGGLLGAWEAGQQDPGADEDAFFDKPVCILPPLCSLHPLYFSYEEIVWHISCHLQWARQLTFL